MIAVAESPSPAITKPCRRPVAKATAPPTEKPVKIGVYISQEAQRKLGATALMEHRDKSDIIDELIRLHLKRYIVQDRGKVSEATLTVTGIDGDRNTD